MKTKGLPVTINFNNFTPSPTLALSLMFSICFYYMWGEDGGGCRGGGGKGRKGGGGGVMTECL